MLIYWIWRRAHNDYVISEIKLINIPQRTYKVIKQTVIVRADSRETGGLCDVLELHHPADFGPPLHYHTKEDEGFYILQGRYRFKVGEKTLTLEPGQFIMAARNVPHAFTSLGPDLGKMLVYFTPGGVEPYFARMSTISLDDPERDSKCSALDAEFGMVILGGRV